ncbi:MAG: transcription-repair coupling factor [Candidatus Zixiibacteriota bacterium]
MTLSSSTSLTANRDSRTDNRRLKQALARFATFLPFVNLLEQLKSSNQLCSVCGLSGSSPAILVHLLQLQLGRPLLFISADPDSAINLYQDLIYLHGEHGVGLFPGRQILPYDFRAPVGEVMGRRISTLSRLIDGVLPITICSIRSLMEPTIVRQQLEESRVSLRVGQEADLGDLVRRLVSLGFKRVPAVEEVGDFALRGGLIDLFSPGSDAPVRVELFGDEVDTIRRFDVATQRTLSKIEQIAVLPRREVPITQETLEQYLERLHEADADYVRRRYLNDPELPGLEWLSVAFGLPQGSLIDYLPADTVVMFDGEGTLKSEADSILDEADQLRSRLSSHLANLPEPSKYYMSGDRLFESLHSSHAVVDKLPFKGGREAVFDFGCRPHPSFGSRLDMLADTCREYDSLGHAWLIATNNPGQKQRLQELLADKMDAHLAESVEVVDLRGGFVCPEAGFAILTDHQVFGRSHHRQRKKKFKEGVAILDYSNLTRGDYVVHTEHGIARYLGLKTLHVDDRHRDCLWLEYAENDRLYIPIEEFNRVSKYSGKDTAPSLTRLGGQGWEKTKRKTRKAVESMAEDQLKLYAQRKSSAGFAFDEDSTWQKQLEASFAFEETPDQFRAIEDVKRDMIAALPMDRLICGDVGFGKTEVAVRAAFKAIEAGKQVAVLVPTTILAQQHHQTFCERLADFPVQIDMLSRFRTRKEQLSAIENLAAGKVDLVIGTHRLFSRDVVFKDLGLLIVDEEHRFGVRHKEKLRQLKANVDTLAMTATPIPRTLQMALMNVRDMSMIATSPKDRLPIRTEIAEFDPAIIATAILREIDRGGQVFFLHNRVQTIDAMYRYLKKIVPQAEIGIAHGQMHEKSLEGVMLAFMAKQFHVLLCTSIIESGLDIPTTNTIIINRADRFGLAQLYQIRGRVGRSDQHAYAYLLTPPTRLLKADAIKRLRALEAHSDLGSGFALAMRDLEIRGAGAILGARQSGFIEEVGYDLYNKLLEEAIAEQQGHPIEKLPETRLEIDIETHLSDEYVTDRQNKVDIYRRLADARNLDTVEALREEVTDRFGRIPQSAVNLFDAAAVKISAAMLDVEKIVIRDGRVQIRFADGRMLQRTEVESMRRATDCPMEFSFSPRTEIRLDMTKIDRNTRLPLLRSLLNV